MRRWCRLPRRSSWRNPSKAQSTHQACRAAQVKHEVTSVALTRRDDQARPRPRSTPGQGRYHHCGDFESHRLATAFRSGLLRRCCEEEAWIDARVQENKVRPHLLHRRNEAVASFLSLGRGGARRCVRPRGEETARLKHQSKRRSLGCAISILRDCGFAGGTHLASPPPDISPAICCCRSSHTGFAKLPRRDADGLIEHAPS